MQVIAQTAFTSPNVATITVAVLDKNGNLMGDNKEVLCQFTDQFSGAVSLEFTRPTAAGQASCELTNGTNPFSVNFVAISEGLTRNTLSFTLGGDGTTT